MTSVNIKHFCVLHVHLCIIPYGSSCIFMSVHPSPFSFGFESYFSEMYCHGAPEGRYHSLRLWMKSWLSAEFSPLLCSHNSVWFTASLPHWGVISSVICWKVWLDWVTKAAASTTRPCVSHMQVSEKQTQSSCHISISFSSFLCSKRSSVTLFTFHVSLPNCVPQNYILQKCTLCGVEIYYKWHFEVVIVDV